MVNILTLRDIHKAYNLGKPNEVKVLSDLSLEVAAGEIIGLIAPSGTGKSTLLNIAGLLDSPDSGTIAINGQDFSKANDRDRSRARRCEIGFVFQFHHLLAEFSARENIMIPLLNAGEPHNQAAMRADSLLAEIGLADRGHHRPNALSGGEQQRVAICRALASRPKLLLADEPTGNLDQDNSNNVIELFIKLAREEGMAALVATHNLDLANKMDRVIDLRDF